jgi:hypothetical protein
MLKGKEAKMRPVGGALFGSFGEKHRLITISGFSTAVFLTGLLPSWQTVSILAPVLLIVVLPILTQGTSMTTLSSISVVVRSVKGIISRQHVKDA